jgi:hypothetical protein
MDHPLTFTIDGLQLTVPGPRIPRLFVRVVQETECRLVRPDPGECWIWRGATAGQRNYAVAQLHGRQLYVNRVLLSAAGLLDLADRTIQACHHCDVPLCVRPGHLFAGTQKVNMGDARAKGRLARGERHGRA